MTTESHWEREAENWVRWARKPGLDARSGPTARQYALSRAPDKANSRHLAHLRCSCGSLSADQLASPPPVLAPVEPGQQHALTESLVTDVEQVQAIEVQQEQQELHTTPHGPDAGLG